jgi:hypothetical protein
MFCALTAEAAAPTAEEIRGTWDMTRRPRRYAVLLELRQADNPHPGYFAGDCQSGALVLTAEKPPLADELSIRSRGGFTARLTAAPRKIGLERTIPGGIWAEDLKTRIMLLEFTEFHDWQMVAEPKGRPGEEFQLTAAGTGKLMVDERAAAFRATVTFTFLRGLPVWSLVAKAAITGADLGLEGSQSGRLEMIVYAKASAARERLEPPADPWESAAPKP